MDNRTYRIIDFAIIGFQGNPIFFVLITLWQCLSAFMAGVSTIFIFFFTFYFFFPGKIGLLNVVCQSNLIIMVCFCFSGTCFVGQYSAERLFNISFINVH